MPQTPRATRHFACYLSLINSGKNTNFILNKSLRSLLQIHNQALWKNHLPGVTCYISKRNKKSWLTIIGRPSTRWLAHLKPVALFEQEKQNRLCWRAKQRFSCSTKNREVPFRGSTEPYSNVAQYLFYDACRLERQPLPPMDCGKLGR